MLQVGDKLQAVYAAPEDHVTKDKVYEVKEVNRIYYGHFFKIINDDGITTYPVGSKFKKVEE